jgi:hypothetical protein
MKKTVYESDKHFHDSHASVNYGRPLTLANDKNTAYVHAMLHKVSEQGIFGRYQRK